MILNVLPLADPYSLAGVRAKEAMTRNLLTFEAISEPKAKGMASQ